MVFAKDGTKVINQSRKKNLKESDKKSLTQSMIFMIVVGWLVPVMGIALAVLLFAQSVLNEQGERTIQTSTDKAAEICEMKLKEIMTASKNASYNQVIRDSYYEYLQTHDEQKLYANITYFLNQQYKYDDSMLCTMVFMIDDPHNIYYTYNTYQESNAGVVGYNRVTYFEHRALELVLEAGKDLDTGTMLLRDAGHIYMIRNLVDSTFNPFAMIVIEMQPDNIFESMESVWGGKNYRVFVDEELFVGEETFAGLDLDVIKNGPQEDIVRVDRGVAYTYKKTKFGRQDVYYVIEVDRSVLINEVRMLWMIFGLILISLIPLAAMMYHFFFRNVTGPVRELVQATEEIGNGNYGHTVSNRATSAEFDYLEKNFNAMSKELKYQFETIFKEELALKDANIMALQSQINPHFLNNTLEIINWEARMSGAENVSGMIEALGTMLRATMNRKQRRYVTLAEELTYVDSYLYIISKRFGDRFQVHREIDESLLQMEVPLLIIQPIVENAVEHGVEENKEGIVRIRIYSDWDKIIIDVINAGPLSEKDKERIKFLLEGEQPDQNERHVSLGIRNVNRRLKIIYGDSCGLRIFTNEDNDTVSRVTVKMIHDAVKVDDEV